MYAQQAPSRQLRRDSPNKVIAGVCAGIAEYFGINLVFTRVVFVLLVLGNGIGLIIYPLLALLIPARGAGPTPEHVPPYGNTPAPAGKSLFAYLAGILGAIGSFIGGVATLLTNISTITSFGMSLIGVAPLSPVTEYSTPIPAYSDPRVYDGNIVSDGDADLRITRITIDSASTHVTIRYQNTRSDATAVWVEAPGNTGSFYIRDTAGRRYALRAVQGIATGTTPTPVASGDALTFTLTFERLHDSVTTFDVIEPQLNDTNLNYWRFSGITLDT